MVLRLQSGGLLSPFGRAEAPPSAHPTPWQGGRSLCTEICKDLLAVQSGGESGAPCKLLMWGLFKEAEFAYEY